MLVMSIQKTMPLRAVLILCLGTVILPGVTSVNSSGSSATAVELGRTPFPSMPISNLQNSISKSAINSVNKEESTTVIPQHDVSLNKANGVTDTVSTSPVTKHLIRTASSLPKTRNMSRNDWFKNNATNGEDGIKSTPDISSSSVQHSDRVSSAVTNTQTTNYFVPSGIFSTRSRRDMMESNSGTRDGIPTAAATPNVNTAVPETEPPSVTSNVRTPQQASSDKMRTLNYMTVGSAHNVTKNDLEKSDTILTTTSSLSVSHVTTKDKPPTTSNPVANVSNPAQTQKNSEVMSTVALSQEAAITSTTLLNTTNELQSSHLHVSRVSRKRSDMPTTARYLTEDNPRRSSSTRIRTRSTQWKTNQALSDATYSSVDPAETSTTSTEIFKSSSESSGLITATDSNETSTTSISSIPDETSTNSSTNTPSVASTNTSSHTPDTSASTTETTSDTIHITKITIDSTTVPGSKETTFSTFTRITSDETTTDASIDALTDIFSTTDDTTQFSTEGTTGDTLDTSPTDMTDVTTDTTIESTPSATETTTTDTTPSTTSHIIETTSETTPETSPSPTTNTTETTPETTPETTEATPETTEATPETTTDSTTETSTDPATEPPPPPGNDASVAIVAGILGVLLLGGILATGAVMYRRGTLPWNATNANASVRPKPISLAKFENHCNQLLETPARLGSEFQLLQTLSTDVADTHTTAAALLPDNKKKNRYTNILPFDSTRVKLDIINDDPSTDYINASFVKGYSSTIEYIACQGPKEETLGDFWRMVYQHDVYVMVMVTNFEEDGKVKCEPYLPKLREQVVSGDMVIRCAAELVFPMHTQRSLVLHKEGTKRNVTHLHFREWPDFGCPDSPDAMLQFAFSLREHINDTPGCVLVHCSAGVGRTGTLIAMDILLQHIKASKKVDIFGTVYKLRKQRTNMVQTMGQYAYIYKCIRDAILDSSFMKTDGSSPTNSLNPIYENVSTIKSNMFLLENMNGSQVREKSNSSENVDCEL